MKRLFNLTSGRNSLDFSRVISDIVKFRISHFEYTGNDKAIHVGIGNYAQNYDETNNLYYTLFFYCHANSSITYLPQTNTEGWFSVVNGLHNIAVNVYENAALATSLTNCYIEIEFA